MPQAVPFETSAPVSYPDPLVANWDRMIMSNSRAESKTTRPPGIASCRIDARLGHQTTNRTIRDYVRDAVM